MREQPQRFAGRIGIAAVVLSALLLLPAAATAAKRPSLASTAQYEAFVEYVKRLDGLAGQPTTAAQKAKYEAELTTKKAAAAHKANALFKRASEEAEAEYDARFKEQAAIVRQIEADELEAIAVDYAAKLDRASASYQLKANRVDQGRQTFETRLHERIDALRTQKAAAADPDQKAGIQDRIETLIDQIDAKRREASQKRADLKTSFRAQKQQLQTAQAEREEEIAAEAEAKIAKIAKHWRTAAEDKKAALNTKRESQLAYLVAKLEKGRASIASMPAVG
jgi:hypothetical protein